MITFRSTQDFLGVTAAPRCQQGLSAVVNYRLSGLDPRSTLACDGTVVQEIALLRFRVVKEEVGRTSKRLAYRRVQTLFIYRYCDFHLNPPFRSLFPWPSAGNPRHSPYRSYVSDILPVHIRRRSRHRNAALDPSVFR